MAESNLPDKRAILQPILDSIEPGWTIAKPSPHNPTDVDNDCIFIHDATYRRARALIDYRHFKDGNKARIEELVRDALKNAKIV
jgi:hypothetical protein